MCPSKQTAALGAKIQCTQVRLIENCRSTTVDQKPKCVKSFHVSCARDHPGVHFRPLEKMRMKSLSPDALHDATPEYVGSSTIVIECLCQQHNPVRLRVR